MTPNAQSGAGAGYVLTCGDKRIEVASQRDIEAAKITAKAGDCEVTAEITNASSAAAQSALAETVGRLVEKRP